MSCFEMQQPYIEFYEANPNLIEMEFTTDDEIPDDFEGHVSEDVQGDDWVVTKVDRKKKRFWVCRLDRLDKLKVKVKLKEKHEH